MFIPTITSAETIEDIQIEYEKNLYFDDTLVIDISSLENDFEETLGYENLRFQWDITGASSLEWPVFQRNFASPGTKEISLNIFWNINGEKTLLENMNFEVFVYEKSIPFIFSNSVSPEEKRDFKEAARSAKVYIDDILNSSEQNLYGKNILSLLTQYYKKHKWKSDYVGIWWEKEFLFSVISKINQEQSIGNTQRNLNLLLMSSFNGKILEWYLGNLLTNKDYVATSIIMSDTLALQSIKEPSNIQSLQNRLDNNQYTYIDVDINTGISKYFFISRFINTLSNNGINTSDIFILIMIPLILTIISFMKHFIGVSPIGITIPLFLSILFYKVGVPFTLVMMGIIFGVNMIISRLTNKYNLLYTPKIGFLVIINMVALFFCLEYLIRYNLFLTELTDIVYIILFIVVAEKLITVIISKEFREYKRNVLATLIISFICFIILQFTFLQIFILAYPEIIIVLAPINFLIGRFTWLRVTEYLRFKEIIKNIEE